MVPTNLLDKYFGWLTFLLLTIMGATQITSVLGESQTADEAVHLSAGYSYLRMHDFRLNYMHPPLGKYINALPLMLLNPHLPVEDPSWGDADDYKFGRAFLYANTTPADTLLLYGRLPTIFLTLCLGLLLAIWTKSQFNAAIALFGLLLFSFDPNIIAHGRYITSDLIVTLLIFAACLSWYRYLIQPTHWALLQTALLLGLALSSKASAVILLPIFLVLYLVARGIGIHPDLSIPQASRQLIQALAVCSIIGFFIVYATYGFETRSAMADKALARRLEMSSEELRSDPHVSNLLRRLIDPGTALGKLSHAAVKYVPIPAYSYISGVYWQADKNKQGHDSYLLGEHSQKGWWYYFPIAAAVKTPTGVLILIVLCLYFAFRRLHFGLKDGLAAWLRAVPLKWYVLTVPPAVYLCASMMSSINIGIRHVLPVYPFVYILLSACFLSIGPQSTKGKALGAILIAGLVMAESLHSYPYYLPFFNMVSGGSAGGPRYLIDSNVDWGQDLKHLRDYLAAHGNRDVCLSYFGPVDPAYYGIRYRALTEKTRAGGCNIAISVNPLYSADDEYEWLRHLTPDARIGYSIYYYDWQKHKLP